MVCRFFGLEVNKAVAKTSSEYGKLSESNYIMDDVECAGTENSLFDCPHATTHNCGLTEAAGVVCREIIKLVGGPNRLSGNVFISNQPVW